VSRYTRPVPLTPEHDRESFNSGNTTLDSWFRRRAHKNEQSGASRTFVTCSGDDQAVAGYYTLAASSVALDQAPGSVRRNMPDPIPVILLGRLAVDERHQGAGLGASLLQDAILRVAGAADSIGVRAILVHAIDDEAAAFYQHFGFALSPVDDRTLFLSMSAIRASAARAAGSR
jgi:GNAT superfamily N-acetyltransferase